MARIVGVYRGLMPRPLDSIVALLRRRLRVPIAHYERTPTSIHRESENEPSRKPGFRDCRFSETRTAPVL